MHTECAQNNVKYTLSVHIKVISAHSVCTLIFLGHTQPALKKLIGDYQPQSLK
jgi:hypothetical protein